jgi:hypothetical protein
MAQPSFNASDHPRQLHKLSENILRSFPPQDLNIAILAGGDKGPWTLDQLHEEDLLHNLKGRRWTQIPPEVIARHLGDFVLLTAEAFATYIPAWLLFALYNHNQGGEFVAHTFAPEESNGSNLIRPIAVDMFRALRRTQRLVLRDFLIYLAEYHESDLVADRAAAAVDAIADLITIFESTPDPLPDLVFQPDQPELS